MTEYLVSFKPQPDSKPLMQKVLDLNNTIDLIRSIYMRVEDIDETSAGIKALGFVSKVEYGSPKGLSADDGRTMVVQINE